MVVKHAVRMRSGERAEASTPFIWQAGVAPRRAEIDGMMRAAVSPPSHHQHLVIPTKGGTVENPYAKAADIMRERGMSKGLLENAVDKTVCLYGAYNIATRGQPWGTLHDSRLDRIAKELFPERISLTAVSVNNHPDTTLEDCLLILKHCAVEWDEEHETEVVGWQN